MNEEYEFCPNCEANLTLQKGYDNNLPYWICSGCGEMLINPEVYSPSDIVWLCDKCGTLLNNQEGFNEDCDSWVCTECGYENTIDPDRIYLSEDEYQAEFSNPYKGLSDDEILDMSNYTDISAIGDRDNIILVRNNDTGTYYVKKLLTVYDKSIYEYLEYNPIPDMPKIISVYESKNCLIVIEEYIEGVMIDELLTQGVFSESETVRIIISICNILDNLHNISHPIIHRDIKPSNVIIRPDGNVCLLDMNASKWYSPEKNDDTMYLGTQNFAAPEQVGFGLSSSSTKSDIYALGMLMNVMLTGHFPKEERAGGKIWDVIERCIALEADKRYTARELKEALAVL